MMINFENNISNLIEKQHLHKQNAFERIINRRHVIKSEILKNPMLILINNRIADKN